MNSWEDVSDLCAGLGIGLDPWQEDVLHAGLGERSDGRWAARQVAASVPRQNGKTEILVARALAGLLLFNERVIIVSAHRQDTAREVFFRLVNLIESNVALEERVDFIARSEMREFIRLKSGQEIRFKARSGGSGRGFSCDCLLLDEAQILGEAAWSAILPTMSARPNPQVWLFGTPPTPLDDAEVFGRLRETGTSGKDSRITYLEWSASREDDLDDPETWAKANPAYGTRIDHEAISSERSTMTDEQFRTERLGIWPEHDVHERVIAADQWTGLLAVDPPPQDAAPVALAVDASHDRVLAIAGCWLMDADGTRPFVELVALDRVADTLGALEWLVQRAGRRIPVVVDGASPAAAMIPGLKQRRVNVVTTGPTDMGKACGMFFDDVHAGRLTHAGQAQLDQAVGGAKRRSIRDAGAWGWDRRDGTVNIAPLVAVTLARFGAAVTKRRPAGQGRNSSRREAVVM